MREPAPSTSRRRFSRPRERGCQSSAAGVRDWASAHGRGECWQREARSRPNEVHGGGTKHSRRRAARRLLVNRPGALARTGAAAAIRGSRRACRGHGRLG